MDFLRLHGLRSCLDDEQFPGVPVLSPFHIHRRVTAAFAAVMVFDQASPAGKRKNLFVGDRKTRSVLGSNRHVFDHFAAADIVNELQFFRADDFLQDRAKSLLQCRLEDIIFIGIDDPLYDVLAQTIGGVDQHDIGKAALGVDGET